MNISGKLSQNLMKAGAIGFLAGLVWLIAVRAIIYQPDAIHYHANFALYINGQRDAFESFTFYEEVEQCSTDGDSPKRRAHMHDFESDIVHVHDDEVTWGHFFANLNYVLGDSFIKTDAGIYEDGNNGKLTFMVNGAETSFLTNEVIGDEDRVLISFGNETTDVLQERAANIPLTAADYNKTADPAACSGSDDESPDIWTRLQKAITF